MRVVLIALTVLCVAGPVLASGVTYEAESVAVDLNIVDNVLLTHMPDGRKLVSVITRHEGLQTAAFWKWTKTHVRGEPEGEAVLIEGDDIVFNTRFMFQDIVPGCQGMFILRQLELGVPGAVVPNDRGVEVAFQVGERPVEFTVPSNLPCMGTSEGFASFEGEAYLHVNVITDEVTYEALVWALEEWNAQKERFTTTTDPELIDELEDAATRPAVPRNIGYTTQ